MPWTLGLRNGLVREAREVVPPFDRPYVTDAGAFDAAFGALPVTDHATALAATVAWERRRIATTTEGRRRTEAVSV